MQNHSNDNTVSIFEALTKYRQYFMNFTYIISVHPPPSHKSSCTTTTSTWQKRKLSHREVKALNQEHFWSQATANLASVAAVSQEVYFLT
jgi:hypothetical protein